MAGLVPAIHVFKLDKVVFVDARHMAGHDGGRAVQIDVGDLRARSVAFTATELVVTLADGRKIATPLDWYPRLQKASAAERQNYEIMPMGIHWPDLDEDLSIAGMLKGQRAL
jgi:hypothetical protein